MELNKAGYLHTSEVAVKNASSLLSTLQSRHSKAKEYFSKLMELAQGGVSGQLYEKIIKELKRYNQTKKTFNEERTPITTILSELAKPFIELENDFDMKKEGSMAFKLKLVADKYANDKAVEEEAKAGVLAKQTAKTMEIERIRGEAYLFLKKKLVAAKESIMLEIDQILNNTSLENIGLAKKYILAVDMSIPPLLFAGFIDEVEVFTLSTDEVVILFNDAKKSKPLRDAIIGFDDSLVTYQYDAIAKIPAIEEELNVIKNAADVGREEELQKAREERIKGEFKVKQEQVKQEQDSIHEAREENEELGQIQSQFEFGVQKAVVVGNSIKKKEKYVITLTYPAGIAEVCKFWLERGKPSDPVKANRMSVGRMITFAERFANTHGEKIVSKYVSYEIKVSAKI